MRKIIFLIPLMLVYLKPQAQQGNIKPYLYDLEKRIIGGDLGAVYDIARFLDDTTFVQEFLGYHNYPNTARGIAVRFIEENCLFTTSEFQIDSSISTIKFLRFLNEGKVFFDDITGEFIVTDLRKRSTTYQLKLLSIQDLDGIDTNVINPPFPEWYYENNIEELLKAKNPEALKWIASAWYKKRSRFNSYYFNDNEFLDLMKKLTGVDLGVPDENGKVTFLYKGDYYAKARLNYLIYWVNNYNYYKWNELKKSFENTKESPAGKSKEEILFGLLKSKNDSLAMDAFTQLAELDTGRVNLLSNDYEKNRAEKNYSLPIFPFKFLKQMVILTQYCRDNNIKYKADGRILDSLVKLKSELHYSERYNLENNLINQLSIDDITFLEYYGLIHEQDWGLTYSLGRILDKFYSKNLKNIIDDNQHLELFLKKAELFDRLGIIGICNKYLDKFQNEDKKTFSKIKEINSSAKDLEIIISSKKLIGSHLSSKATYASLNAKKERAKKYGVIGFKQKYQNATKKCKDEYDCRSKVASILGLINYQQLGEVLQILRKDSIFDSEELVRILDGNFGIPAVSIDEFLQVYNTKNEHDLYDFYFKKTGIEYLNAHGELMYEKIYDLLKYDIVDAFVGGGGGRREEGIYPMIKLLELKFKTTLGFSEKLCDSGYPGIICGPTDRARAWMKFFEEKKLVASKTNDPVSISD